MKSNQSFTSAILPQKLVEKILNKEVMLDRKERAILTVPSQCWHEVFGFSFGFHQEKSVRDVKQTGKVEHTAIRFVFSSISLLERSKQFVYIISRVSE